MRMITAAVLTASAVGAAVLTAAPAQALPVSGCQDDLWITLQATRRSLCDSVLQPDGSWWRAREFYTPAHQVPLTTTCSGGVYSSFCTTTGGYWQDRSSQGVELYLVFPDTVLPDEPPHLVTGLLT